MTPTTSPEAMAFRARMKCCCQPVEVESVSGQRLTPAMGICDGVVCFRWFSIWMRGRFYQQDGRFILCAMVTGKHTRAVCWLAGLIEEDNHEQTYSCGWRRNRWHDDGQQPGVKTVPGNIER